MRTRTCLSSFVASICFTLLFFLNAWLFPAFSQVTLTVQGAVDRSTQYVNSTEQDPIYVFCGQNAVLEAVPESVDSVSWLFVWTKYDPGADSFLPLKEETSLDKSTVDNPPDGLYKVVIEKTGFGSFEEQAWVFTNPFVDRKPVLDLDTLDCEGVHLKSSFEPTVFQYHDISSVGSLELDLMLDFTFSLTRNDGEKVADWSPQSTYTGLLLPFLDSAAFEGPKDYVMTVRDACGYEFVSDVVATETYVVEAGFDVDPSKGEAPLEVSFTNTSVNSMSYQWFLYQDFDRIDPETVLSVEDSLVTGIIADESFSYTYMHPGDYLVKLIVESDKGPGVCSDESVLETPIAVDTSLVDVPNVFTPNGDGRNDVFRVKSQSLKSFHAIIFNRWGRVVYEWRNADEGWDGRVNGKWATPGTYFYVITAVGREEEKKKHVKKGSVMLIRK